MGRRALAKIDPNLDLTDYLISAEESPQKWSSQSLFNNAKPLEIEVGTGKGLFLCTACETAVDRNLLGIEVSFKYARFAAAKLAKRSLRNGKIVHGNAEPCFHERVGDQCLHAVHIYFPDPWWKARHRRRRIMNENFLRHVQRTLQTNGSLHFWSDVDEYFYASVELISRMTQLGPPKSVDERPAEHEMDYHTHYERRTRLAGLPVYRAEFRKTN